MPAEIVPLRPAPPTLAELVARVRTFARDSESIGFLTPHVRERLAQRGVTMRQVLETLRGGEGVSGPRRDDYGDWRIKLMRRVAGRRVQVVVAVKDDRFTVITVI